jgi:exopolysaccharide biosynthesis polyprenyl glycosylphosphotransferase
MAVDTALGSAEVGTQGPVLGVAEDRRVAAFEATPIRTESPAIFRDAIFRRALVAADALVTLVILGVLFGSGLRPAALLLPVALILVAKTMNLYDRDEVVVCKRTLDDAPGIFHLSTLFALGMWLGQSQFASVTVGPRQVLGLWITLTLALLVGRTGARRLAQRIAPVERCLVLAEDGELARLAEKLEYDHRLNSAVVAHLPLLERRSDSLDPPHAALERSVDAMGIHRVVVAPDGADAGVVLEIVSRAKALGVNVSVLPRICEVVGSSVQFDDLGGMTLLGVRSFRLARSSQVIKRAVDVVGAAVMIVLGSPILAAIAVAIRLDSAGPVLFRQIRVGQDGKHFFVLKFRTMFDGAHVQRAALAEQSAAGGLFKVADDPRVTRVGRLLRRTSFDELPQLWNVLRGEMSLVGPRPLVVDEDRLVQGYHRRRLHLKPGLTGPWQVLGSPEVRVGVAEMATIDYLYAANWSLWTDVQVILRTIVHVLSAKGV